MKSLKGILSAAPWNFSTYPLARFVTPRRKAIQTSFRSWKVGAIVFKGIGNLANFGALMKQAQEIGGKMQALQEELKVKRATGSAGGGLVEVEVNGLGDVLGVRIDPSLIAKGDGEMIEDLLPAAINAAQRKAKQIYAEAMQALTGGIPLPGLQEALSQLTGDGTGGANSP
jgi:DNA-binding YbaB/EbfC family protein